MGGGGVVRRPENSLDNAFFSFSFSPMVLLQRKLYFSNDRGGPTFLGGGGGGGGGSRVQVLISIETHITCDFPGGGGPHRRITLPYYICKLPGKVKSGKFGHYLQIVLIQMRRLLMSRHIRSFTICLGNLFLFQYLKYETNKVAVRN